MFSQRISEDSQSTCKEDQEEAGCKRQISQNIDQFTYDMEKSYAQSNKNDVTQEQLRIEDFGRQAASFERKQLKPNQRRKSLKQLNLQEFKNILYKMHTSDFAYLFKLQDKVYNFISEILNNNWNFYKIVYQPIFQRFQNLLKAKIEYIPQSKIIYSKMCKIQKQLEAKTNFVGNRKYINCDEKITDTLYQHFIQQLLTKQNKNGVYYILVNGTNEKRPLCQQISMHKQFFRKEWKQILEITRVNFLKRLKNLQQKNNQERKDEPNCQYTDMRCLSSLPFLQLNSNIFQYEKEKQVLVVINKIVEIDTYKDSIQDQICALLNNGKGGVIFFDCDRLYISVIPRGSFITQKQKVLYEQKILQIVNGIYPRPLIGQDKEISFGWVPMVQRKSKSQITEDQKSYYNFIEGLYIGRIIVKPMKLHVTYFWTQSSKPIISVRTQSIFPQGKRQIKKKAIYKFIKQKFSKYQAEVIQNIDQDSYQMLFLKDNDIFQKKSKPPEIGIRLYQNKVTKKDQSNKQKLKFKNVSIVVAKTQDFEAIQQNLKKNDIDCYIENPFENQLLKGVQHSGILYHDCRFDDLLKVISNNNDFKFGGKQLFTILITPYLRLLDRNIKNKLSDPDIQSLESWLKKKYPQQSLKMFEFINDKGVIQYYLSTGSKQSMVYIYLILTQFSEKSALKMPQGLESMPTQEKSKRFKQVYPKISKN